MVIKLLGNSCEQCGNTIPSERRKLMPNTTLCVQCVDAMTTKHKAYMVFSHKTAPTVMFVDTSNAEAIRQADRCNERKR